MAKRVSYNTRMESVQEEQNHNAGWGGGGGWDQGGWGEGGFNRNENENGWQNTARDNDVQPGDSISNASFGNTDDTDWEAAAPTPPTKDAQPHMLAAANGLDWGTAASGQPARSALKRRHQSIHPDSAIGLQSALSAIAEQRQAQLDGLTEQLRELHSPRTAQHTVQKAGGRRGKHQREASWGGAHNQASEVGTSHSNRPAGIADAWGGAWGDQQNANGNDRAATSEAVGSKSKSKKRPKSEDYHPQAQNNVDVSNGGWGAAAGDTSWGGGGGWGSSVAPGGFGNAPNTSRTSIQAPGLTESNSWGAWPGAEQDVGKGKPPKSGLSGFFKRIFGRSKSKKEKRRQKEIKEDPWDGEANKSKDKQKTTEDDPWGAQETKSKGRKKGKEKYVEVEEQGKKGRLQKKQKFAEPEASAWPTPEDEEYEDYEDEDGAGWGGWEDVDNKEAWASNSGHARSESTPMFTSKASDVWRDPQPMKTSKAYAFATDGRLSDTRRSRSEGQSIDHRIIESKGEAFMPARAAFYSTERLARDRIFWFFDPRNDPRVVNMLQWIEFMQGPLATFGFSKFLESRERGALFTNIEYRSPSAPHEPAFDWLTFDKVQPTMDKILQESLAFYDPSSQILVFVFLLSKSRRSMAIWRRKLPLPENIRHTYGTQIMKLISGLDKQYPVHVDEMPARLTADLDRSASESGKKKWLSWGRT